MKAAAYVVIGCTCMLLAWFGITAAAEGDSVEVKPEVIFPIGQYQLIMSSVPGLPIKIISDQADVIKLEVTEGNLLVWTPPASAVLNKGKKVELHSGDTIYWTPVVNDDFKNMAAKSTIVIKAYKDNHKLGSRTAEIVTTDNITFRGKLLE